MIIMRLLGFECKRLAKSISWYIYVICVIGFYFIQVGHIDITEPKPNQEEYGHVISEDETIIRASALEFLNREYEANLYATYPTGFYRAVILDENEQQEVKNIIDQASNDEITYDEFLSFMTKVDSMLGGSSTYRTERVERMASVDMTYEQALAKYQKLIQDEKLSGAYARIMSDYIVVIAGILPVFLAIYLWFSDKKGIQDVIHVKSISTYQFVLARFLSLVIAALLPILLLGIYMVVRFLILDINMDIEINHFAYFTYIFGWILPTIMMTISLGMFFTIITDTPISLLIQSVWWFIDSNQGVKIINGGYDFLFMPRHNVLGNYEMFKENFSKLFVNRLFYSMLSIFIVIISIVILDYKRKGRGRRNGFLPILNKN